jgi:glycosyltransferase involved in cell wall biosynthesis
MDGRMRVRVVPHLDEMKGGESGIHEVVRKWFKYLPKYGIELVKKGVDSFDILAVHAGMASKFSNDINVVSHLHGLYWTSDYAALAWEWAANASVIESIVRADAVTVPSNWVNETLQRDMRISGTVIPHGVDWDEWQHERPHDEYILAYAKNRVMDVCNPAFITELARRFPDKLFLCTFAPKDSPNNVRILGLVPHEKMKEVIQRAAVLISPVKETFGILTLESMASGTPVLGYDYGGNRDLIKHGVNGYLARPLDIDDLASGLDYCLKYRDVLGKNGNQLAKEYTWDIACEKLAKVYESSMILHGNKVSVVIPSYNYAHKVGDAIESALNQTRLPIEIIVIDDGSTDDTEQVVKKYSNSLIPVRYYRQDNGGVAVARNRGISISSGDYVVCLDADDRIDTEFLRACIESMDEDPTLGIAYTGLLTVSPDGKSSVSPWPPPYNFDNMVYDKGINQIPTCCMFRKNMWQRLGGYRSRYCPNGAGSEDAEFWLRAGLYGFKGKKVTDAPLFIYSYKSGRVSGDKNYREIDWRSLHPSTKDQQHPFACVATPANGRPSHPVRQYDEPVISVIIPIGPGHKQHVFNALDSLESQTLRRWEAILIDDTGEEGGWNFDGVTNIIEAYPYVRLYKTEGKKGSGFARNLGVKHARAPLVLFLDADDNLLVPNVLETMLHVWNEEGAAVYTDYASKSFISEEEAERLKGNKRLLDYNPDNGLAMHLSYAADYDCDKAVAQPANPLYIWNLITTLIPKIWHNEIGGFDENMPSWEDWEYWLRMARAGKCFVRIAEPMVAYRFYTGVRRETGIQMPRDLLDYITKKLEGVDIMPCRSCGGNKRSVTVPVPVNQAQPSAGNQIVDKDMVLVVYDNPNRGQHKVVGASTKINYGYRQGGGVEKFYVHKDDIANYPDWFRPFAPPAEVISQTQLEVPPPPPPVSLEEPISAIAETSMPAENILDFIETKPASENVVEGKPLDKPFDLQGVPGVTDHVAEVLHEFRVSSWEDIVEFGKDKLMQIDGVGEKRAEAILAYARKNID